jgi:hypothetical protein
VVLRTFDVGSDQLNGATYAGDEILVGRATSAGDIWNAELRMETPLTSVSDPGGNR